jgi:hypothetical protein
MVTNTSVRTDADVRVACRSSLTARAASGCAGAAVPGDPLVAFGAVVGDGADHDDDLVDELGAGRGLEQRGQPVAVPVALGGPAIPMPGWTAACGDRPGPGGVVLDERDPALVGPGRGCVVDLHPGQDPGQVGNVQVVGGPAGGAG